MTRSEIREAIKKVFFEEIEPDSLTKSRKAYVKNINQTYKTLDGKYTFKSRHEVLAYNIFDKKGISDQIKPQDRQFQKTCNKIPDFVWENKKIIIEIAGMDDIFKPGYWEKLENAKPCLEKQGYTVYIIDTRTSYHNYIKFYNYLCDLLGFTPKPEIKDDIFSYIGDPIDIIKRNQEIIQYKRDNQNATQQQIANKFNAKEQTVHYILKQAGLTTSLSQTQSQTQARNQEIIQYKKDNPNATNQQIADKFNVAASAISQILKPIGLAFSLSQIQSQAQVRNQEIIQYKKDNPNATTQEIADKFNLTPKTVYDILKPIGLITSLPQIQAKIQTRNQEIIQYKKDNPNATRQEIADKFNLTLKTIQDILKQAGETTSRTQILAKIQARNQEIIQYKKDNPNATYQEIADKFNVTAQTVYYILKPTGLITSLPQIQAKIQTRNQEIIQYVNDNPEFKSKPAKIAKKFNLPVTTINNILTKLKKSNSTNEQSINYKTMTRKELREIIKKAFLKEVGEKTAFINGKPVEYREESELARLKDNSDIRSITTAGGRKFK